MFDPMIVNLALPPRGLTVREIELAHRAEAMLRLQTVNRPARPARPSAVAAIVARLRAIAFPAPRPPYGRPLGRADQPALPY